MYDIHLTLNYYASFFFLVAELLLFILATGRRLYTKMHFGHKPSVCIDSYYKKAKPKETNTTTIVAILVRHITLPIQFVMEEINLRSQ